MKKKRTIALMLLCGAVGAMVLYDTSLFKSNRGHLKFTILISDIGIINGLGTEIHPYENEKYYNYQDINEFGDIYAISSVPIGNAQHRDLIKKNIYEKNEHHIFSMGGYFAPCRASKSDQYVSCLPGKNIVVFDAETGKEILRYTYPGGGPGSNFDKMEWLSEDELVLLDDRFSKTYEKNILRLNINTGVIVPVCDSDVRSHLENGVLKKGHKGGDIQCSDLPEFAVLFGSREWPVQEKYPSDGPEGDRFYFYPRWIPGPWLYPGKTWIEGYDKETGDTFYVATIDSILKSIFGDSFIVDWFGWQTVL